MEKKITKPLHTKLTSLILLLSLASPGFSQQIIYWNAVGQSSFGVSPWGPTTANSNLTVGGLTRGAGVNTVSGTPLTNAWGGCNFTGAANEDITFTVTANAGAAVSFGSFNLSYRRSNTGPTGGTLEYAFGNGTTYTVISSINNFTANVNNPTAITPINLSNIPDLQLVPAGTVVKFRILPTGATTTVGTLYIAGTAGMSITGTVVSDFYAAISQSSTIACNGQATGALIATANGTTAPYTYSWMPSGGTGSVAAGLAAGVYTCLVTDVNSATTIATYTLTQPAALVPGVVAQTSLACPGGANASATISATGGVPAYTYSWAPTGGNTTTAGNLTGNIIYTVTVTDSRSCSATTSVYILQPALFLAVSPSALSICNGGTVSLTASGANTYTWTGGLTNGTPFSPTTTATYSVSGTETVSGCTSTESITIQVNPSPTVTASSNYSNSTACSGASVVLTASGANTYSWTGGISNGAPFTPTSNSSYTVTGTSANGCESTAVIALTIQPAPSVIAISSRSISCKGETATLTAHGAMSYSWSCETTPMMGTASVIAVSPTVTTSYSVSGTGANGCIGAVALSQLVSNCTGVDELSTSDELLVFPNPSNGVFTIKSNSALDLTITDELGQALQTLQLNEANGKEVSVRQLSSGIYFITVRNAHCPTRKIIINQ